MDVTLNVTFVWRIFSCTKISPYGRLDFTKQSNIFCIQVYWQSFQWLQLLVDIFVGTSSYQAVKKYYLLFYCYYFVAFPIYKRTLNFYCRILRSTIPLLLPLNFFHQSVTNRYIWLISAHSAMLTAEDSPVLLLNYVRVD